MGLALGTAAGLVLSWLVALPRLMESLDLSDRPEAQTMDEVGVEAELTCSLRESERQEELDALLKDLQNSRRVLQSEEGRRAEREGVANGWPDGLEDRLTQVSMEAKVESVVSSLERSELSLLSMDCEEYPCVLLLSVPRKRARSLERFLSQMTAQGYSADRRIKLEMEGLAKAKERWMAVAYFSATMESHPMLTTRIMNRMDESVQRAEVAHGGSK